MSGRKQHTQLIRCRGHQWAPGSIVCIHLLRGISAEWIGIPVDEGDESAGDWLCPVCFARFPEVPMEDLQLVCMHHVRERRNIAEDAR